MLENPKYDVALSFLQQDVNLALALASKLQDGLDVFFYPERQEEQGGTDGMTSMRSVFFEDSRLAVILYRDGWGKTRWTQVEEMAIKASCFDGEWRRLFVLKLDESKLPDWISPTHISYRLDQFGIDGAVGAIKMRVVDNKGAIKPMTPLKRAELQKDEDDYQQASRDAVSAAGEARVREKIAELMQELAVQCDEINASGSMHIGHGEHRDEWSYVLTNGCVSVGVYWRWQRTPTELGVVRVIEFDKKLRLPNDPPIVVHHRPPQQLRSIEYKPSLSRAREVGWKGGEMKVFLTSKGLAERCVIAFIELTNKKLPQDRGLRPSARRSWR